MEELKGDWREGEREKSRFPSQTSHYVCQIFWPPVEKCIST